MDYGLNDIVEMKKQHPCRKSKYWQIIRMGADIKIKCQGCGAVVMFPRSKFEQKLKSVVTSLKQYETVGQIKSASQNNFNQKPKLSTQKSNEIENSTFISLNNETDRLVKIHEVFNDMLEIIGDDKLIFNIQLIDSANNHVTKLHKIENRVVKIIYKTNGNLYKVFQYKCHYCLDCNCYFDFYQSFMMQLKKNSIDMSNLMIRIVKVLDDDSLLKKIDDRNLFDEFNSESLLHAMGYRVGYSGLSWDERKKLLDSLLKHEIMTIYEMKSIISNNIRMFSKRDGYELAVEEWKEDINYLNDKIKGAPK